MLPDKVVFLNLTESWHSEVGQEIGLAIYTDDLFLYYLAVS